jgi:hypothetical protein
VNFEEVVKYVNGLGVEDIANMTKEHSLELKSTAVQPQTTLVQPVPVVA